MRAVIGRGDMDGKAVAITTVQEKMEGDLLFTFVVYVWRRLSIFTMRC